MSRVVRARYEKGVLKLLDKVDLEEGKELLVKIIDVEERRRVLEKYRGILGRVDPELVEEAVEEAEHL